MKHRTTRRAVLSHIETGASIVLQALRLDRDSLLEVLTADELRSIERSAGHIVALAKRGKGEALFRDLDDKRARAARSPRKRSNQTGG